ncbi:hypothetical protein GCM10018954_018920 [Kutzneria kofuensis]
MVDDHDVMLGQRRPVEDAVVVGLPTQPQQDINCGVVRRVVAANTVAATQRSCVEDVRKAFDDAVAGAVVQHARGEPRGGEPRAQRGGGRGLSAAPDSFDGDQHTAGGLVWRHFGTAGGGVSGHAGLPT